MSQPSTPAAAAPPQSSAPHAPAGAYALRRRLPEGLVGDVLFSAGLCLRAPYFATVLPRVRVMEPGRSEVTAPRWWGIRNHLGTFHAIAACNLAEVAMGMLCEATVPASHRWIPKAMQVRYLAKATTGLRAVAELNALPDFEAMGTGAELTVPVRVVDSHGTEVVHAEITTWVTPR